MYIYMYMYTMYNISVHVLTCTVHAVLQSNQYCSGINWKNLLATEAADRSSSSNYTEGTCTSIIYTVHVYMYVYTHTCVHTYMY